MTKSSGIPQLVPNSVLVRKSIACGSRTVSKDRIRFVVATEAYGLWSHVGRAEPFDPDNIMLMLMKF